MNRLTLTLTIAALALAACATPPESVAPAPLAGAEAAQIARLSCRDAEAERRKALTLAASLEDAQRAAAEADALAVFLVGLPVASMTGGDRADALAAARGHVAALDARLARC